jgi:histone H3/H4
MGSWTPVSMQTGILANHESQVDETLLKKIKGIMTHFMENAITVGCRYVKASDRDMLTSTDIMYALKYQARTYLDNIEQIANIEDIFDKYAESDDIESDDNESESDDNESESDDNESESVSEEEEEEHFTRCDDSTDPLIKDMNMYHDTWDQWVPDNPIQTLLKNAVDNVVF